MVRHSKKCFLGTTTTGWHSKLGMGGEMYCGGPRLYPTGLPWIYYSRLPPNVEKLRSNYAKHRFLEPVIPYASAKT